MAVYKCVRSLDYNFMTDKIRQYANRAHTQAKIVKYFIDKQIQEENKEWIIQNRLIRKFEKARRICGEYAFFEDIVNEEMEKAKRAGSGVN